MYQTSLSFWFKPGGGVRPSTFTGGVKKSKKYLPRQQRASSSSASRGSAGKDGVSNSNKRSATRVSSRGSIQSRGFEHGASIGSGEPPGPRTPGQNNKAFTGGYRDRIQHFCDNGSKFDTKTTQSVRYNNSVEDVGLCLNLNVRSACFWMVGCSVWQQISVLESRTHTMYSGATHAETQYVCVETRHTFEEQRNE